MKHRLGSGQFTQREKLLSKYTNKIFTCPGYISHDIQPRRKEILFNHYVNYGNKAYVMYWRSHPNEYKDMCKRHSQSISDNA